MIKVSESMVKPRTAASILRRVAERIEAGEIENIQLVSQQHTDGQVSTGVISIQLNAIDNPARARYERHVNGGQRLTKEGMGESA